MPDRPDIPGESVDRWYLVRCGECGFVGGAELGHCAKCGYDGIDPASEGLEVMRIADARQQISEKISPALRNQGAEEERERLAGARKLAEAISDYAAGRYGEQMATGSLQPDDELTALCKQADDLLAALDTPVSSEPKT